MIESRNTHNNPAPARRVLLTLNPHSRNGDSGKESLVVALKQLGVEFIEQAPSDPQRLSETLGRLDREHLPPDRILVGGGDGTINRLLPQLLAAALPVGIIPLGTANDLARTLGIPEDPVEAVRIAATGRSETIDLGMVNGKLYANVASIGLGPKVTERLSGELKQSLGVFGYPRILLNAYRESKPFHCRISVDGTPAKRLRTLHLAVGNGRFYGGGTAVFEDAAIDDRRLDLFSLSPIPLWRLLTLAPWLRYGRHRVLEEVWTAHGTSIEVTTSHKLAISADGELVSETPARFELLPRALEVCVPSVDVAAIPGLNQGPATVE